MRNTAIAAGVALAIAALFTVGQTQAAETVKSPDGKCFQNVSNGNWAWTDCKKEKGAAHKHKG